MMKIFFFRRTGRGGGKYTKSKLKPLARWLQRRLIWLCGYSWDRIKAGAAAAAAAKASEAAAAADDGENGDSSDDEGFGIGGVAGVHL
jgi:hypothetical protein